MSEPRPISERIRGMAADHEAGMSRGRAEQIAARAVARARADAPARRRSPVAVLAGVTLLFAFVVGLGALADSAVPGQFLYSIDRAYETVGFGGNGAEERLEEAIVLVDRGDPDRAVVAVNEALEEITKRSSVSLAIPPLTLPVDETTTTPPEQTDNTATAEATAEMAAESTVDEADPVQALKLAAEYLLRTVREESADEDLEQAASELAAAAASLDTTTTTTMVPTTDEPSTTTTTTEPSTTTTVDEPGNGNGRDKDTTTTTTLGDSSTTTVPEDGESTTTTTVPPIVLPPAP